MNACSLTRVAESHQKDTDMYNSTVGDEKVQQFLVYGMGNDYSIFSAAGN